MSLFSVIHTKSGKVWQRAAWTGGDHPPDGLRRANPEYRELVSAFFREEVSRCFGLDFWKCAGTGGIERARIFWNRAKLDSWRTLSEGKLAKGWVIARNSKVEFWRIGDEVFRASTGGWLDADGLPISRRWECGIAHWRRYRKVFDYVEDVIPCGASPETGE